MDDVVIVCTKDRPDDVRRLLTHLAGYSEALPPIVIWDASSTTGQYPTDLLERCSVFAAPRAGLTKQRNDAVRHVADDFEIVHFIDDDSLPDPGYFRALREAIERDGIDGAGGVIRNEVAGPSELVRVLIGSWSPRGGRVLASGRAVTAQYADVPRRRSVSWLSGCSMTWRTEVVREHGFDERLEGYCFREDVDFGCRASSAGAVMRVVPAATLRHVSSSVNRWTARTRSSERIVAAYRWCVENGRTGPRLVPFWWATVGEGVLHLLGSLMPSRRREQLAAFRGIVAGVRTVADARRVTP